MALISALFLSMNFVMPKIEAASATASPDDWPMFHHDLRHTGHSISEGTTNKIPWQYTTGARVLSSPAVADGMVFVGSEDSNVYCFGSRWNPCDIDRDHKVNILDISIAAAFGTKPGDPRWNPAADINGDGQVNIVDLAWIARVYGKPY